MAPAHGQPLAGNIGEWIDPLDNEEQTGSTAFSGAFVKVEPGSLLEVRRVRVFVHGWLRGGLASSQRSVAVGERVARAWDQDVTNMYGRAPVSAYSPLLNAMAEQDPESAVLWFSWIDQSATDGSVFAARTSLRHAPINGRRLAAAIAQAIWDGVDPRQSPGPAIQLIGHSHGSVVAVNAALAMPLPPAQLTVLDCPEDWFSRTGGAAGLLSGTLPRLHPSRRPGTTFVDAYSTMFGRSYHDRPGLGGVVDVRVAPDIDLGAKESAANQAHQYAVTWYRQTVENPGATCGWAWSPLNGFDPQELSASYASTSSGHVRALPTRTVHDAADQHVVTGLDVPTEMLTAASPDLDVLVDLPQDSLFVEFDIGFAGCGKQTRVDVAFDGNLAFTSYAFAPVPRPGRFIRVAPGPGMIQFRVVDAGEGSVTISRIRVVADESAAHNADDLAAMVQAGRLGALAGSAATAIVLVAAWGLARALNRSRS